MAEGTSKSKSINSSRNNNTSSKAKNSSNNYKNRNTSYKRKTKNNVNNKSISKKNLNPKKEEKEFKSSVVDSIPIKDETDLEKTTELENTMYDILEQTLCFDAIKEPEDFKKDHFVLIELILILILIVSVICSFVFYNMKRENDKDYNELVKEYNILKDEYDTLKNNRDSIQSDIDAYKDIDASIQNMKVEYFQNIKKIEDNILNGKSNRKIAYLTFDDGPYYNTYRVFDILDQYGIKATFFTTNINGEYCFDNKSMNCWIRYQEYLNHGHTIANHTYTHAIFRGLYNTTDSFMNAVIKQEELIREKTGYTTNILRFPGGSSTAKGLKESIQQRLRERGYGWVDWNAQDGDGGYLPSSEVAWEKFTSSIDENIEVILYHDYNDITIDLLPKMIEYLQNNGYEMYPLFYESHMISK